MHDGKPDFLDPAQQRQLALSARGNEGDSGAGGPQQGLISAAAHTKVPELTNAELVQLRIRVIALENLVISLLAQASEKQLDLARDMATYISPRPGFTHHPLTMHAAACMLRLVERGAHFKVNAAS